MGKRHYRSASHLIELPAVRKCGSGAFTLIELLVVIAILGILIGLIFPGIQRAKEKARQAYCMNNLKQVNLAMNVYRNDHEGVPPPWLSTLFPSYLPNVQAYICKSDNSKGADGSKPEELGKELSSDEYEFNQFKETDDNKGNNGISACSYMYELCDVTCSYQNRDFCYTNLSRTATWYQVKTHEIKTDYAGEESVFPVIRCFQHYKERTLTVISKAQATFGQEIESPVTINVTYAGNVLFSGLDWTEKVVEQQ